MHRDQCLERQLMELVQLVFRFDVCCSLDDLFHADKFQELLAKGNYFQLFHKLWWHLIDEVRQANLENTDRGEAFDGVLKLHLCVFKEVCLVSEPCSLINSCQWIVIEG